MEPTTAAGLEGESNVSEGLYRIAIVGATTLAGKELADELEGSLLATSDFVLLDGEEATGQVAAVGDEAAVVEPVAADSFERMDFVFFAGDSEAATTHWESARKSGASIIDLTAALEDERGVLVRAPWVREEIKAGDDGQSLNLETTAVVAAHPAAVMLALVAARVQRSMPIRSLAATLVEPASQQGSAGMDELHQQTVNLLSFQSLPKEQFDAQVAFNVLPALGEGAKVSLLSIEEQIVRHYGLVGSGRLPKLDLELIQAPVFHGYVASVLIELEQETTGGDLERALAGEWVDVISQGFDPPSNLSAAGQEDIMVQVKGDRGRRFWLWLAADNLKLAALNGIACANELKRLRPRGKVQ